MRSDVIAAPSVEALIQAYEATLPFALDEFQREAIGKLEASRGVLVSAPTSSGKTVVAEYAIWRRLRAPVELRKPSNQPADVVYTTPLKALSNQKYHDLCARYGEGEVGLVTGEHTINDGAPIVVMTTEILRNVVYDDPARVDRVGDVVLDEIHYIDEYPRGTVWEELIIEAPRHIRLIGLSATISNVDEVAEWMSGLRGAIQTVVRSERPVALETWLAVSNELHPLFDPSGNVVRRTLELAQRDDLRDPRWRYARRAPENDLLRVIEALRLRSMLPAIYFIFSRRGCREALSRCDIHGIDLTQAHEKAEIDDYLEQKLASLVEADERRCMLQALDFGLVRRGLAMHHAGMLPAAKEAVEQLFQRGRIKVVFATETLSLGLNMPARSCVVSSFTKFDGTGFVNLTSGELTQLLGRAGRRGIDTLGHGVILKENDVDVRDIYEAALSDEFSVQSKFAPTYSMVLNLLRTRSSREAEDLLERSFGQFQTLRRSAHWTQRRANLQEELEDLRRRRFRHPRVPCTERTLTQFLGAQEQLTGLRTEMRRARRDHWHGARRGRRYTDVGQRYEALRRRANPLQARINESPCHHCPYFSEHRAHRREIEEKELTLGYGEAELDTARDRFRREFRAFAAVLRATGFLRGDELTDLGMLAASLYGESALLVADAIAAERFIGLRPEELAATLVMVVAEDRGRGAPRPGRRRFPAQAVDLQHRHLRQAQQRFAAVEHEHGLNTVPPLSYDFVQAAFEWASGVDLSDIEPPGGADLGDVVKAVKNLYSLLRQMEQALRGHHLLHLVATTRERLERDLIRRV
jgi:ATP-dependent RNA helicase HelY